MITKYTTRKFPFIKQKFILTDRLSNSVVYDIEVFVSYRTLRELAVILGKEILIA